MAKDVTLTDINGEKIYPKTYMKNVYDSSGQKTLEDKMATTDTDQIFTGSKTLNAPLIVTGGDASSGVGNIQLDTDGNIIAKGTNSTLLGLSGGNLLAGHSSYPLLLRGKNTRPTYNGTNMATVTDVNNVSLLPDGTYSSGSITATGTKLTAPCNGYLFVSWGNTTGAGYIGLSSDSGIGSNKNIHSSGNYPTHYLPVAKGDIVTVTYTSSYTNNATYKFIKTKGV